VSHPSTRRRTKPAPPAEPTETVRARLAPILRNPAQYGLTCCCLCAGRVEWVGIFSPTESFAKRIGEPEGKRRLVVYGLCEPCSRLPDRNARVEAAMLRDFADASAGTRVT
jgi:hypothetical protein